MKTILFPFFLLGCTANKQPEDTANDPDEEVLPDWLDISVELESTRTEYSLPALGAAVIQAGEITKLGTVGLRSTSATSEVTDWDKWHIGSCTKAMTSTLTAMYIDEGLLSWETTLAELFPSIEMQEEYEAVTVRMLLSHYGGTWSQLTTHSSTWNTMLNDDNVMDQRQQVVTDVLTSAPEVTPGTEWLYSNAGFIIVGTALENLTGNSWENQMQEKLFDPLSMSSCGFGPQDPNASLEHPWGHRPDGTPIDPVQGFGDNPPALGPAGTVHCNLPDWAKFIAESLKLYRGESTLVSALNSQEIFSVQGNNYAAGWFVFERNWAQGEVFTHSGSNTINYAVIWGAPELDEAYLAVTNIASDSTANALDSVVASFLP